MILFTVIVLSLIVATILAIVFAGIFGGATLLAFGDIIVCGLIVYGIFKLIFRKKK